MVENFNIPFIIGTGSGGGKIVSKITAPIVKVAVNSSWRDLDALPEEVVKIRAGDGYGSGMDPKKGERDYKKGGREGLRKALEKIVKEAGIERKNVCLIPIVVSTGFGFGTGSGPLIVEDVKKWFPESAVLAFVVRPFSFEGDEADYRSHVYSRKIAEKTGTVLIDNEYVSNIVGQSSNLWQTVEKVNRYVTNALDTFIKTATTKNILAGIDRTDLKRVTDRGLIYFFTRTFEKDLDVKKLYDSDSMLTKYEYKMFSKPEKLPVEMLAFIQSPKIPETSLISMLRKYVEDNLRLEPKIFKVGIFQGERVRASIIIGGVKWWVW